MEIRKQKPKRTQSTTGSPERPVRRERVEATQRRAGQLNDAIENKPQTGTGESLVRNRQQEIQQQMAQLRREAVQARRLAEQINNLSQEATAHKRQSPMSDTPTIDHGQTQPLKRRASDKPRATGSQSKMNPLHPSMELPPEQLIRLLGLEDKLARKKHNTTAPEKTASDAMTTTVAGAIDTSPLVAETAIPRIEVPTDHKMYKKRQRRHMSTSVFPQRRTKLLVTATGIGLATGIAVSAYLFWWQPAAEHTHVTPVVKTTPTPAKTPTPAATLPTAALPATRQEAEPAKTEPAPVDNPQWRAVVAAQEQRLRAAAEQRLRERMQSGKSAANEETAVITPSDGFVPAIVQPSAVETPATDNGVEQAEEAPAAPIEPNEPSPPVADTTPVTAEEAVVPPNENAVPAPATPAMPALPEAPTETPAAPTSEDVDNSPDNVESAWSPGPADAVTEDTDPVDAVAENADPAITSPTATTVDTAPGVAEDSTTAPAQAPAQGALF